MCGLVRSDCRREGTAQRATPAERGTTMKTRGRMVAAVVLALFFSGAAAADTLELKDGRVLHGRYLGGTQTVLRFEINGQVQTFYVSETVALTFTGDSDAASAPAPAPPPAAAPPPAPASVPEPQDTQDARSPEAARRPVLSRDVAPPASRPASATPAPAPAPATADQDPAAQYGEVTIPAGQPLLVRMIDGVDSSRNHVGDVFHASLETDLYVKNTLVARKGTDIYGRLANAHEAGHLSGSAELQLRAHPRRHRRPRLSAGQQRLQLERAKPRRGHRQESGRRGHLRSHHRRHCWGRRRRGDWSWSGLGRRRRRAGIHQGTAGQSTQRNFAGIPAAAAGCGYAGAELSARSPHPVRTSVYRI